MRSSTGARRKGLSAAAVVATVVVACAGVGVLALYGTQFSPVGGGTTSSSSSNLATRTLTGGNYSTTTFVPPSSAVTSASTASTTSTTVGPWQAWAVANATLGYGGTQAYIAHAWNYTFYIYQSGSGSPGIYTVSDLVRTMSLGVAGNWTTGYTLTYSPSALNVTVEYDPPSTDYHVVFFNAQNGSAFSRSILFNGTQRTAIATALANSTVRADLSQFPYFVDDAFIFPAGNHTYGGDYLVWFYQANGPRTLGAFVDMSSGSVVSLYNGTRALRTCYSNGACFSSPWGS